eukprot:1148455-Pelagomonas_calceolata.AAC.3
MLNNAKCSSNEPLSMAVTHTCIHTHTLTGDMYMYEPVLPDSCAPTLTCSTLDCSFALLQQHIRKTNDL